MFSVPVRLRPMLVNLTHFPRGLGRLSTAVQAFHLKTREREISCLANEKRKWKQKPVGANIRNLHGGNEFLSLQQETSPAGMKILDAEVSSNLAKVTWEDGSSGMFPLIYLRDICQCSSCCHPDFYQRMSDVLVTCELDYSLSSANVTEGGRKLDIIWSDKHHSRFESQWLHNRQLRDEQREKNRPENNGLLKKGVITWAREMSNNIPTLDYHQLMTEDTELLKWLDYLLCYGLVLIKGAPAEKGHVMPLAARVGYSTSTFYEDPFQVPGIFNTAKLYNTGDELPFHTDLKYAESIPAVLLMHFINQATIGGESRFADGFHIACELARRDPEAFRVLTETFIANQEIDRDINGEFITRARRPTFTLDFDGTIRYFNFHETSRDFYHCTTLQNTESFIRAYGKLVKLIRDPSFAVEYRMKPGDIMTFNNQRVMHARRAFICHDGPRKLEGTYFDWDPIKSKMRVLARKMNIPFGPTF